MQMFVIQCSACHVKLKVRKQKLIGRKVPCPRCGDPVLVLAPKEVIAEDNDTLDIQLPSKKTTQREDQPKRRRAASSGAQAQAVGPKRRPKNHRNTRRSGKQRARFASRRRVVWLAGGAVGVLLTISLWPRGTAVNESAELADTNSQPVNGEPAEGKTAAAQPVRRINPSTETSPRVTDGNSRQVASRVGESPKHGTDPIESLTRTASITPSRPRTDPQPTPPTIVSFDVDRDGFNQSVRPFFQQHCVNCHGSRKQEAKLRLDQFEPEFGELAIAAKWHEVLDRINAGEMPPEGEPQPDSRQLTEITDWITGELHRAAAARHSTGGQVVLRRLNRNEYRNTIRDLIGINYDTREKFPEDPPAYGFDNIGAALMTSPLLIESYMHAAREVLDRVFADTSPPQRHRWRFDVDVASGGPNQPFEKVMDIRDELGGQTISARLNGGRNPTRNGMVVVHREGWQESVGVRDIGFNVNGDYIVRVRAAGIIPSRQEIVASAVKVWQQRNGIPPWARQHFEQSRAYDYGPPRMKVMDRNTRTVFGVVDVTAPPNQPQVYEFQASYERGLSVFVGNIYHVPRDTSNHWFRYREEFAIPHLLIDWVEIEGPLRDESARAAREQILSAFGNKRSGGSEDDRAEAILRAFMGRAWRRPVTNDEVAAKLKLFTKVRRAKSNFEEAIKVPLIAVLTSPNILFLTEPADATSQTLTAHELAARLSYFLWSSMPDAELFQLASDGGLSDRRTLVAQVDRMLADPKSDRFVRNFAGQWLGLRKVGTNPPARDNFPGYDGHLQESMIRESEAFFAEILNNDLSVMNFVKSDFVTINERLARFYDIPGVKGDEIRRVSVPRGVPRGGLMTQGSVLTVTSNGTRTVPVWRGVWVLENMLGERIPPPPPNAGEIPQLTAAGRPTTIRARMEQHRQVPACATCHNKIDPLGFALENFRGDGGWATQEANGWGGSIRPNDPVIDASGRLPDGRTFKDVQELQQILMQDENRFLHCLTEKLVTYSLGRGVEFTDRDWIDGLVRDMKGDGRTLRGLIKGIVASKPFHSK